VDISKPLNCSVQIEDDGEGLVLQRRPGSSAGVVGLSLFLIVWTLACVFLARQAAQQPTLEHILFGVPFWASWVGVLLGLFWMIFGVETLRLGQDSLSYCSRAFLTLNKRQVPRHEIQGVTEFASVRDSEWGTVEHGLKFVTWGRPLRFFKGLGAEERMWLRDLLQRRLPACADDESAAVEVLNPIQPHCVPPTDNALELLAEWDRTVFTRRRSINLAALYALTFINVFWSGVVAIFLLGAVEAIAVDAFAWFTLVLLVPFVGLGLVLLVCWWVVLTAPFWVNRWSVSRDVVASHFSVFGIGRTRAVAVDCLQRIEVRKNASSKQWRLYPETLTDQEGDAPFALALVGRDAQDLLTIDHLTEGEARWMGGHFCDLLATMLPKRDASAPLPDARGGVHCDRELDP
jgi:hypothetical protein